MTGQETKDSPGRHWNLGKPPRDGAPLPDAETEPMRAKADWEIDPLRSSRRPPRAGEAPPSSADILEPPEKESFDWRGLLASPVMLVLGGLGAIAVIGVVLVAFASHRTTRAATAPAVSPAPAANAPAAAAQGGGLGAALSVSSAGRPAGETNGRLLLAAGEILQAVAGHVASGAGDFEAMPPSLVNAPLPAKGTPEYYKARFERDQRLQEALTTGKYVAGKAAELKASPAELAAVGRRLSVEGLVLLDGALAGGARAEFPGLDGARAALENENAANGADPMPAARAIFPAQFADAIASARGQAP